jgi:hypothetical protein
MRLRYDIFFEVEFVHTYFSQTPSDIFDIVPTAPCREALRDSGLLCKKMPYGFCIVYEYRTDGSGHNFPARSIPSECRFTFTMKTKNLYVLSYSELPFDGPDPGIYAFNNLAGNFRDGKYLLTSDTSTSYVTQNDLVELCWQRVVQSVSGDGTDHDVVVKDGTGASVLYIATRSADHPVDYEINLRGHKPGLYSLEIDGVQKNRFYADDAIYDLRPFGIVDIYLGSAVQSGFSPVNNDGTVTKRRFTVQIDRRQLYWRYVVALKYRNTINTEDLIITHLDSTISFIRGPSREMADGTIMVPFVSSRMLPLQHKAQTGITLSKAGNGSGTLSVDNLPNPSFENVIPNTEDGRVYSDVYVYI